jgi:hypothetical protein
MPTGRVGGDGISSGGAKGVGGAAAADDALAAGGGEAGAAAAGEAGAIAWPPVHHLVPFDRPVPLSWVTMEGVFTFLWATNTSHQSIGVSTAAGVHHADGAWAVTVVRDTNPCNMLRVLLSLDNHGGIGNVPGVETVVCSAWRLEPDVLSPEETARAGGDSRPGGNGFVAIDGEAVP